MSFEFLEVLEERLLNDLGSSLKKKKEGKLRKIVGEREGWVEREKKKKKIWVDGRYIKELKREAEWFL